MTARVNSRYDGVLTKEKPVASLLRELRETRGQSLRATARDLGVDPAYLSRIETGQKPMPDQMRSRVADYYEADPELMALAEGRIPDDIRRILMDHPPLLAELRRRYAAS